MGYNHWILVNHNPHLGTYIYYATKHKYNDEARFWELDNANDAAYRFETTKAPYFTMYEYNTMDKAIFGNESCENIEASIKTFTYGRIVINE